MYRIISTTDNKFVGREFESLPVDVLLDDYHFKAQSTRVSDSLITLSNVNYIIVCKEE